MSKLLNADAAYIDERKITAYLLSASHSSGRHKARFFESFGFTLAEWQRLRDSLLAHALTNDAVPSADTAFGPTFEVTGPLSSPDGRNPHVLVAWMIRNGEDFPRFVTAVPSEPRET